MSKPRFPDRAIVRFPPGMLARVEAVLKPGEDRGAFILAATAAALRRLEREKSQRLAATQAPQAADQHD